MVFCGFFVCRTYHLVCGGFCLFTVAFCFLFVLGIHVIFSLSFFFEWTDGIPKATYTIGIIKIRSIWLYLV